MIALSIAGYVATIVLAAVIIIVAVGVWDSWR